MNWLMLRGLVREQRHWMGFPDVFAGTVADAKVHCLDYAGIGTESHRGSPLSVPGIMEDVRQRWLELQERHEGPWSLFAVSLGAMVGLTWAQRYPQDFQRLVVCNTSLSNLSPFYHRFDWRGIKQIPPMLFSSDPLKRERAILTLVTSGRTDIEPIAQQFTDYALALPKFRETGLRQLQAASRLRLDSTLAVPLLVLSALGDGLVSPKCPAAVARHFQAPLVTHPWGGHDLPLEDPQWVSDQVQHWLVHGEVASAVAR